jgi:hypothetical protein
MMTNTKGGEIDRKERASVLITIILKNKLVLAVRVVIQE